MRFVVVVALALALALGCASLLLANGAGLAQIPDKFENLQVLGNDVERKTLVETMRGFSFALGARCEHCHVGGAALDGMDFASDEKAAKQTARKMLRMTRDINETYLSKLEGLEGLEGREGSRIEVTCFTCHRGVLRPEPIESLIGAEIRSAGLEAGVTRYRELREKELESGSYNFGVTPLNRLAESFLAEAKPEWAVGVLELNAESHQESSWLQDLLGDAYATTGDRERARAAYEKSLSLFPDNPRTRQKLQDLGKPEAR